ncbi:MAG TPA: AAA family ATPase, partial [Kofleriaceae bacterium]|nr:AAA family ATPase [Kofleriaceae bacterium]
MTAPLHPNGALRARIDRPPADDVFRRLGVGARKCDLGDEGLYLAEELISADSWLAASEREPLAILVLALMIAQRQGSTRLPLDPRGPLRTLVGEIARVAGTDVSVAHVMKAIANLTGTPRFNSVIGTGDARAPLIVDHGCLYTERSRWLEQRIAGRLALRLVAHAPASSLDLGASTLSVEQRRAVELALTGSLAVVTGGPGTGKTVVAAAIVRGLAQRQIGPIALAAQTGKAANRLTEVLAAELASVTQPSETDRLLAASPPIAQTLHRLLGYRGNRFAHHAHSPLPVGALIVDEASMIDLELMDAILDALPASAPLVLIGDANQLPAIDAGQILADLAGNGVASSRVARLDHSYRMDAADPRGR